MPKLWSIKQVVEGNGQGVIENWLAKLSDSVEIKLNERLRNMEQMTTQQWSPFWAKQLNGPEFKGLFEIRFKVKGVQHRPICWLGPDRGTISLLFCAKEVGGKFVPKQTGEISRSRKSDIIQQTVRLIDYMY